MSTKLSNINQFHPMSNMSNYELQNYMMKNPYDFYYQQNMMENFKNQGYPIDSNMYYRMNSKLIISFNSILNN